jgi:hypothetical protein
VRDSSHARFTLAESMDSSQMVSRAAQSERGLPAGNKDPSRGAAAVVRVSPRSASAELALESDRSVCVEIARVGAPFQGACAPPRCPAHARPFSARRYADAAVQVVVQEPTRGACGVAITAAGCVSALIE